MSVVPTVQFHHWHIMVAAIDSTSFGYTLTENLTIIGNLLMSQGQTINCIMCFGISKFLLDGANYNQPLFDRQQKGRGKHLSGMVDQVLDSQHG